MRTWIGFGTLVFSFVVNSAFGQDPTVPSKEILQRLKRPAVQEPKAVTSELPVLKLKAMVLSDRDHGTGIIEADGRRYTVRLARTERLEGAARAEQSSSEIEIAGRRYLVEDFSARSILLDCDGTKLLVQ